MAPNLGQMIGPLPLGAWVGVVGAGVGVAYLARKKTGAAPAAVAPVPDSSGADDVRVIVDRSPVEFNTVTNTPRKDTTNAEWQTTVAIELIGRGFGALATNTALSRYLRGDVLTAEQKAIIEAALRISSPPYAPPPPANDPPPPAPPTTTTPTAPAGQVVLRLFNPATGEHFWTASKAEADAIVRNQPGWKIEGPAFGPGSPGYGAATQSGGATNPAATPAATGQVVLRLFNPATGEHFWTASKAEADAIVRNQPGWKIEGPAFGPGSPGYAA